ncbi:P-loop containing nucleoside triphosphate hydrolase protein [Pseudoneurospora amorphoporcata]|uniref:P-loop containing nucleoside triphosphate hydrolase protein n=1 Tax=Pseudoneurospora amorphoporcata TaxID=241081 RepID=A0AAN6SH84_9PEZI|nr:P-loop containing nucleoside triphosphate hydrolase protein [Pseudoneurospora amorphoporcata]
MSTPHNKAKGVQGLDSLGNHIYLEKQDRLRDIGIDIQTSQIVVVGGQSSGKSSLLELLTGFAFPRGQGLCTRYATQITLRRNPAVSIVISITPRNDCGEGLKAELREFRRELEEFDPKELGRIIEDAAIVMGIRAGDNKDDSSLPMFSDDILKVEISGPDQPHLTVIDVPGLFQVTGDAGITELDKTMVERMVKRYMANERTIVLAVVPALSDPATERILQLAKEADPSGVRTIGVLTKADLVYEKAVLSNLLRQVQSSTLKLGYFIVRNRGADEDDLSVDQCKLKERELFLKPQWSEITRIGRTGVGALRLELQNLLMDLAKRELPKQKAEVMNRLSDCLDKQREMGIARPDPVTQREYLTKHASKFERIARDALEGRYGVNPIFAEKPELRLITKIISLNEGFSDLMWKKGHLRNFVGSTPKEKTRRYDADDSEQFEYEKLANEAHGIAPSFPELRNVFPNDSFECEPPSDDPIMEHIGQCYRESRGPELGTFGGSMLPITFREQARKWAPIANAHVRTVIIMVHCFIKQLLSTVFVDERMRDELWDSVLLDTLVNAYTRALRKADYLIGIELRSCPSTYNHYFADNLQKSRTERLEAQVAVLEKESQAHEGSAPINTRAELKKMVREKSNAEQVKEDIHDTLKSYYKVARKRFVDVMCQQAIDDHLLNGDNSPLRILTSDMVAKMSDSQLDRIAGEDAATKRERKMLEDEIAGLNTALDVLRS